jgi:hypothetical protein
MQTVRSPVLALVLVALGITQSASPVVPPPSASARDVLVAYLNALDADNCGTARMLATDDYADTTTDLCSSGHLRGTGKHLGQVWTDRPGEVEFMTALTFSGTDTGNDGTFDWFYSLTQDRNGAWRVVGGGTGP